MNSSKRVDELDAVRGIAAFVVVLHHCWQAVLPDQNVFPFGTPPAAILGSALQVAYWVALSPLRLLFAGHAAVAVFFVLSGFVLAKSMAGNATKGYLPFLVRRVFRIWVPFAVVILLAASAVLLVAPRPVDGYAWLNASWSEPPTWNLVAGHLAMLGVDKFMTLDNPMWSLVHEMRISIVFPVLAAAALAAPRLALATSAALFTLLSVRTFTDALLGPVHPGLGRDLAFSGMQTVRYVFLFMLGILLAQQGALVHAALDRLRRMRWLAWLAAFALLWLATLGAWAWAHRRRHRTTAGNPAQRAAPAPSVSGTEARSAFHQACRSHAARSAREALLTWSRATWPHDAPVGLNALARRLDNPALTTLLRELDRACIADTAWNGDALARALHTLDSGSAPTKAAQELPGLYNDPQR